jgi:hypothetical protein
MIRRSFSDEQNWPGVIDWQNERLKAYRAAFDDVLGGDVR